MSVSYQRKIEVVSNYIVNEFIRFCVKDDAEYNEDAVQYMYRNFDNLPKKVIKDKKFEPHIVNQSAPKAKEIIFEQFAEFLI